MIAFRQIISSDTSDLTRFNVYAPWVQRLEVFSDDNPHNFWHSSKLRDTLAERPLLPNLRILSFPSNHKIRSDDYELFVDLFVCLSLVEIQHGADHSPQTYLDWSFIYHLVRRIHVVSPDLRKLEFYPKRVKNLEEDYWYIVSAPRAALPKAFAGLTNLRHFSSSVFILKRAVLQALGGLLALNSLGVVDYNPEYQRPPYLDKNFKVLDAWFPALRNLRLYDLHPQDITAIWSQPSLVQRLHSVTVRCYPGMREDDQVESLIGQEWIDSFLSRLPHASPHIEELDLDFVNLSTDTINYSLPNGREDLRRLPLRSARLQFSGSLVDL